MGELQRRLAAQRSLVAEGRDMGTVVFPDAAVKIFLDATLDERVRRRHLELIARGHPTDPAQVRAEMAERDRRDREREVAPLRPAADALVIDCTGLTVEGQIAAVLDAVRVRTGLG
jgi:cytidylate kinase